MVQFVLFIIQCTVDMRITRVIHAGLIPRTRIQRSSENLVFSTAIANSHIPAPKAPIIRPIYRMR